MSRAMNEFKPGLEGVVAVETEIAEPDREGGSLRYRGIDIEELVGHYPYERVWGLLVDNDLDSQMPDPEPYEPAALTGGGCSLGPAARRRAGIREADAGRGRRDGRPGEVGPGHARLRQADHGFRPPHLPRRGSALTDPQGDRARARLAPDPDRRDARRGCARRARAATPRAAAADERRVLLRARARR